MKSRLRLIGAILALALPLPALAGNPADLVFTGGAVYTVDASRHWAQAVAVRDDRIVYVGTDAGAEAWIGPETRVVPLGGRMLLPGFEDAHVHPLSAGVELAQCNLNDLPDQKAILAKVRQCAAEGRPDEWLVGGGWSLPAFPGGAPTKQLLDAISSERPIALSAADGHSGWVNSAALARAGITKQTPDPPSGRIERDPKTGEATGTLREKAMDLVWKLIPEPGEAERLAGLRLAIQKLNGFGITALQEANAGRPFLETYRAAERAGELSLRVVVALSTDQKRGAEQVDDLVLLRKEFSSARIHPTAAKIFEDGVIEARTAAMNEPYSDRPGDRGTPRRSAESLNPLVKRLVEEGFTVHVHAIGDRAVRLALDALEAAGAHLGDGRPHQLAHIEVIDPPDVPRFRKLGVIANFQPLWAFADTYITDLTLPALGPERSKWIYPMGDVERTGGEIAFGSDWSVSSPNPLEGIQVAITRQSPTPPFGEPFLPEQTLDLPTALAAYTIGSANALGLQADIGSIEVGKYADLVVLDRNLFAVPVHQIHSVKVLLTLLGGRAVYRDPAFDFAKGR